MKNLIALVSLLVLFLSGCANHGAALINSRPSGAEVVDVKSGVLLGVTPLKYRWRDDNITRKFVTIRMQKDGYRDKTNSFWVDLRYSNRKSAMENAQSVDMFLDTAQ